MSIVVVADDRLAQARDRAGVTCTRRDAEMADGKVR